MCVCKHTNRMRQKSVIKIFFFQVHTAHNYFDDSFCDTIKIEPFSKEQPFACPILMRMRILRIYFGSHSPRSNSDGLVSIYIVSPLAKKKKNIWRTMRFDFVCNWKSFYVNNFVLLRTSNGYQTTINYKRYQFIECVELRIFRNSISIHANFSISLHIHCSSTLTLNFITD